MLDNFTAGSYHVITGHMPSYFDSLLYVSKPSELFYAIAETIHPAAAAIKEKFPHVLIEASGVRNNVLVLIAETILVIFWCPHEV